jgi:hypothetical protein
LQGWVAIGSNWKLVGAQIVHRRMVGGHRDPVKLDGDWGPLDLGGGLRSALLCTP